MMLKSIVLSLATIATASSGIQSLGCYNSAGSLKSQGPNEYQSTGLCTNICRKAGYSVAGLHDGSDCYCGNEVPPSSAKVDEDECDSVCDGFPSVTCGGPKAWTVLSLGSSDSSPKFSGTAAVSVPSSIPTSIVVASGSPGDSGSNDAGIATADAQPTTTKIPSSILTVPSNAAQSGNIVYASPSAAIASKAASSSGASASPSSSVAAAGRSVSLQAGSGLVAAVLPVVAALL